MKKTKIFFSAICLLAFLGCAVTTKIKPYYPEGQVSVKREKNVILSVNGLSSRTFVRICAPAGMCSNIENSDDIKEVITETAKRVLMDKGYKPRLIVDYKIIYSPPSKRGGGGSLYIGEVKINLSTVLAAA